MVRFRNMLKVVLLSTALCTSIARAELDPDLKATQSKNDQSLFLGANLAIGQAYPTKEGSPGLFFKSGFDVGFILPRGNWDRIELGAEFFFGKASAKISGGSSAASSSISTDINGGARFKIGYGYSLGYNTFLVTRANLGPAFMTLKGEDASGMEYESKDTSLGIVYGLGADIAAKLSNSIDLNGGVSFDRLQYDPGKIKVGGISGNYDGDIQMNLPHIHAGIRVLL